MDPTLSPVFLQMKNIKTTFQRTSSRRLKIFITMESTSGALALYPGSPSFREGEELSYSREKDDLNELMLPLGMFFPPSEYQCSIKLQTQCYIYNAVTNIREQLSLTEDEKRWFLSHPQFKHFFHMPESIKHKSMGTWMLLLRTACTEKKKEAWFVVNDVPIRYSLREHALIIGLRCNSYPKDYKTNGSFDCVIRVVARREVRSVARSLLGSRMKSSRL